MQPCSSWISCKDHLQYSSQLVSHITMQHHGDINIIYRSLLHGIHSHSRRLALLGRARSSVMQSDVAKILQKKDFFLSPSHLRLPPNAFLTSI